MTYDWLIVGGGIVGLSLAKTIRRDLPNDSILILDKEEAPGVHASGRNSGVLHAGIYYKPGSLKAKLCSTGSKMMKGYCKEHNLPLQQWGKVIVPISGVDDPGLDRLYEYALGGGAQIQQLDGASLRQIEPAISPQIERGLYSPATAVVDPIAVVKHLVKDLEQKGVDFAWGEEVHNIDAARKKVFTTSGVKDYGHLINCAGAHADKIAKRCGVGEDYHILPFKGIYYQLSPESPIKITGNIYPVPDLAVPFLGVHFTKGVHGKVYIGPTALPALGREHYQGMQGVSVSDTLRVITTIASQYTQNINGFRPLMHQELPKLTKSGFYQAAKALVPELKIEHLLPSQKVGIRAQLFHSVKQELVMDFAVENGPDSTHILNAVSPAFTSGFSFADYVWNEVISKAKAEPILQESSQINQTSI